MNRIWHRVMASLTPGVRVILCLQTLTYLLALIGQVWGAWNLYRWVALSGPAFWSGRLWELVTYVFLPASPIDFLIDGVTLVILGGMLERSWSRFEFWAYCAVVAVGTGLAQVVCFSSIDSFLAGATSLGFGLLVGWGYVLGHERVSLLAIGEISARVIALVAGAISLVTMWMGAGLIATAIMCAGGVAGFIYLWILKTRLMTRDGRVVPSERMNRLEL
jgi:membrane associated rhomboid family serine protease